MDVRLSGHLARKHSNRSNRMNNNKLHHATRAKANRLGIIIAPQADGAWDAYDPNEPGVIINKASAKEALAAFITFRAERAEREIAAPMVDEPAPAEHEAEETELVQDVEKLPTHWAIARKRYKEASGVSHCGDWLAQWLDTHFTGGGDFDWEGFKAMLAENFIDVDHGKWSQLPTSGQAGWQGRYRMNGRQKLGRQVALNGFVTFNGEDTQVPDADLAKLRIKHPLS